MSEITAILVDDESSARDVLENLLARFCPGVKLLAKCSNVEQAVESIKLHQPDLVFLDIEMPNYAGYEIVDFFTEINFEMIFVTAYDQYAIKAFEVSAVDYLLKPIEIDRLKEAVARSSQRIGQASASEGISHLKNTLHEKIIRSILVTKNGNQYVLELNDIIAIEAQESYSTIYTLNDRFVMSKNLKYFERTLEGNPEFIRVHKSWMINRQFIVNYSKSELQINLEGGITAKLSKYKKAEFELSLMH